MSRGRRGRGGLGRATAALRTLSATAAATFTCEASPHNLMDILDTLRSLTCRSAASGANRRPSTTCSSRSPAASCATRGRPCSTPSSPRSRRCCAGRARGFGALSFLSRFPRCSCLCLRTSAPTAQVDPVPVAVVADKAWDASTFKDVAASLAKAGDDQLLE